MLVPWYPDMLLSAICIFGNRSGFRIQCFLWFFGLLFYFLPQEGNDLLVVLG
jgi:hypothetical protein